jgi:hypothetical protein
LVQRPAFTDALLWLEVFEDHPETADALVRWEEARQRTPVPAVAGVAAEPAPPAADEADGPRPRRRRRRRRRRNRGTSPES